MPDDGGGEVQVCSHRGGPASFHSLAAAEKAGAGYASELGKTRRLKIPSLVYSEYLQGKREGALLGLTLTIA